MEKRRIVFLGYDGAQLLDFSGPHEVFATASFYVAEVAGLDPESAEPAYEIVVTSVDGGEIKCFTGPRIAADCAIGDLEGDIDTLILPGTPLYAERIEDEAFQAALRGAAARARRVGGICTSSFQLANAGLLDGRKATTHWQFVDHFEELFPAVEVERFPIFVEDGPIFTSAGVTAGIDLALAMVEADHGSEVARRTAQFLVVFMQRPGSQAQFSARLGLEVSSQSPIRGLVDSIAADPAGDHSLEALAGRAGYSERHLVRLFQGELGRTPARFVEEVRVEAARSLLQGSDAPLATIAEQVGLGSAESLRRCFTREVGITPGAYRQRFRTTGVSGAQTAAGLSIAAGPA